MIELPVTTLQQYNKRNVISYTHEIQYSKNYERGPYMIKLLITALDSYNDVLSYAYPIQYLQNYLTGSCVVMSYTHKLQDS